MARRCPSCQALNTDAATFCAQCHRRFVRPHAEGNAPGDAAGAAKGVPGFQPTPRGGTRAPETPPTASAPPAPHGGPTRWSGPQDRSLWADARTAERFAPGLGHLRTDQPAMGVARAGITLLWLLSLVVLWFGGTAGRIAGVPLVVGIITVWVTGPIDVGAAPAGRTPWLDARRFALLVLGVTMGVIVLGGVVVLTDA